MTVVNPGGSGSSGSSSKVVQLGNSLSGAVTCDLSQGVCFVGTLTGNVTISFINWPASPALTEPLLMLTQNATGGWTITVTGVVWEPSGTPPPFNTAPGGLDIIPLSSPDQGTHLYGASSSSPSYKSVVNFLGNLALAGSAASGSYVAAGGGAFAVNAASSAEGAFWFDPADHVSGATLRIRGQCLTNAVAPAVTFSYFMAPVTGWGGASGANPIITSLGTGIGTATITSPAATSETHIESAAFAMPTAGWYVLALSVSTTVAANANTFHNLRLDALE